MVRSRTALRWNCACQIRRPGPSASSRGPSSAARRFLSRNRDIKSPLHMIIHDAITNDAASTIEDHVCSNQNAENRYPMSPELPNGVFILTKTPFARCLHHVISFEPPYRSNKNWDHKENREKTPFGGSRTRVSEWQYLVPKRRKQRFETQEPTTRFFAHHR